MGEIMIKLITFCFSVIFALNLQADTTDSKWKNIIEIRLHLKLLTDDKLKRQAILDQLDFHKTIIKSKGDKHLFQQSAAISGVKKVFCLKELREKIEKLSPHIQIQKV